MTTATVNPAQSLRDASVGIRSEIKDAGTTVKNELQDVVDDVMGVMSSPSLRDNPEIRALRERLQHGYERARTRIAHASEVVTDNVGAAARATDEYAHEQPWKVAGVAALAGLAIGVLLFRR
ncbi:MAG: DUF883 domain-containing protein [Burkholderiales bacterium]|nr:DUF883 domain-containing protein [Burkholderiales bacterium]